MMVRVRVKGGMGRTGVRWSSRTRQVARIFGLRGGVPARGPGLNGLRTESELKLELELAPGNVILLTGASGAGKSTLLRQIEARLRADRRVEVLRLDAIGIEKDRAVVDCFDLPLEETMGILARAGLAEARLWLRVPAELSEGEQFRYRLARCMAEMLRAPRGADAPRLRVLMVDEFCSVLDRTSARVVAWQFAKFVRGARNCSAVVATAHEDLLEDLMPARVVRVCAINSAVASSRAR